MTLVIHHRTLIQRVGGPQSMSWPVMAAGCIFLWLVFFLFLVPAPPLPDQIVRIGELVVAQLALMLILRGSRRLVLERVSDAARGWLTVAVFAVASGVFCVVFGLLISMRPVPPPAANTFGYADTTAALFAVFLIAAIATDAFSQHRRQQEELRENAERLQHVRAVVGEAIAERQRMVMISISDQVAAAVEQVSESSPREAVETLRWTAQDLVRPLSHDLATNTVPFEPTYPAPAPRGVDWASVLNDATSGRPIRVLVLTLVSLIVTAAYRVERFGISQGLLSSLVDALAIALGAVVANRVLESMSHRLSPASRAVALTLALAIVGSVGVVAQKIIAQVPGTPGNLILNAIITVFVGWALAMSAATQRQLDRATAEIEEMRRELDWEVARANQLQWQQQRSLARALHGPMQSAVNAAALRIDAAVRQGTVTPELVDAERASILAAMGYLHSALDDPVQDVELAFRRVRGTWADLCDIDIDVADDVLSRIAADPSCSSAVTDIVTELCANAIRHGQATRISVRITHQESERLITLVIDNNGRSIDPQAPAGLGTSIIKDVACDWTAEAIAGGTRMTVTLPIAIPDPSTTR